MITGNPYLLSVDLTSTLSIRHGGNAVDSRGVERTDLSIRTSRDAQACAVRHASRSGVPRPLPFRTLEPHLLDEESDDVDEYAARCLSSPTLASLYDLVIATAELRAGRAVVRDVLLALGSGVCTPAELAHHAGGEEHEGSVAHVLAILGNHIHRTGKGYRLTPQLRSAVERRYPLGSAPARDAARELCGAPMRRTDHLGIDWAWRARA